MENNSQNIDSNKSTISTHSQERNHEMVENYENLSSNIELNVGCDLPDFLQSEYHADKTAELEGINSGLQELCKKPTQDVRKSEQKHEDKQITNVVSIDEDETDTTDEDKPIKESLLDNSPFMRLAEECCDILNEIDGYSKRFKSNECMVLLEILEDRLKRAMLLSGAYPINNDKEFNLLRHVCKETVQAKDGMEIKEYIQSGVAIEDRVMVKAIVTLKKNK